MAIGESIKKNKGLPDKAHREYSAKQSGGAKVEAESFVDPDGVRRWRGSFSKEAGGSQQMGERYTPKASGGGVAGPPVSLMSTASTPSGGYGPRSIDGVTPEGGRSSWLGQSIWTILGVAPGGQEAALVGFNLGGGLSGRDYKEVLQAADETYVEPAETGIEDVVNTLTGGQLDTIRDFKTFETHTTNVKEFFSETITNTVAGSSGGVLDDTKDIVMYAAIGLGAILVLNLTRR